MLIGGFIGLSLNNYPDCSAAVIFSAGCNFNCPYCHNPQLISATKIEGGQYFNSEEILCKLALRRKIVDGVVFSGGEPLIWSDIAQMMQKVKELGLKVKLDTNGMLPNRLEEVILAGLVDFIAMDVKANAIKYPLLCGTDLDYQNIKRSIQLIKESGLEHEFRTTWIPEVLNEADIVEIAAGLPRGSNYYLQKFNWSKEILNPELFDQSITIDARTAMQTAQRISADFGLNAFCRW